MTDLRSGTGQVPDLFYEDLAPGRSFDLGVVDVDPEEMLAFGRRFDPQWYHVDAQLAADSPYGALIASGFFTASLFMRAYVDHVLHRAAASTSPGLEELRWTAPVYGGDRLAVRLDVIDRRPSQARPGLGTVTLEATMTRVSDERVVMRTRFRGWFAQRAALQPSASAEQIQPAAEQVRPPQEQAAGAGSPTAARP